VLFRSVVTGGTASAAAALTPMDIIPCPAGGFTPTAKVPTQPGVTYSSTSGVLRISSGTLTLTDTSYFFSSIVMTGSSTKLAFPGTSHANVVLRDSLNVGTSTIVNSSLNATSLSFASCGTSATPAYWALSSGGTASYFSVYAPNHVVYELGGGRLLRGRGRLDLLRARWWQIPLRCGARQTGVEQDRCAAGFVGPASRELKRKPPTTFGWLRASPTNASVWGAR